MNSECIIPNSDHHRGSLALINNREAPVSSGCRLCTNGEVTPRASTGCQKSDESFIEQKSTFQPIETTPAISRICGWSPITRFPPSFAFSYLPSPSFRREVLSFSYPFNSQAYAHWRVLPPLRQRPEPNLFASLSL